jgi:hypothetical protein
MTQIQPAVLAPPARGLDPVVAGVLVGGTAAGLVDIFAAAVINHLGPGVILQAIASGLLGAASFRAGAASIALGLGLQIAMSLVIAAIYGAASLRLPALVRRPAVFGALYGVGVFIVMNLVVVPLSAAPMHPKITAAFVLTNLAAMIVFGLIVAFSRSLTARRSRG